MGSPVTHWQIVSKDPGRTAMFYGGLFDWKVTIDPDMGYRQIDPGNGRGIPGGIWPAPPGATNFVQLFMQVEDLDAHVARATGLGAKVIVAPQGLPEGGRLAVLLDPDGMAFGLYSGKL